MVQIRPIKGIRFRNNGSLDHSKVITPPYDVISEEVQEDLYQESNYNIIRLEYGKSLPGDSSSENKYTRAAATLSDWLRNGILIQEEKPAIYLYEQHFEIEGKRYVRESLFCSVKLSPFEEKEIIPHEETMSKPKEDRLELLRHCETNFSPIFGLYEDKKYFMEQRFKEVKKDQEPTIDFTDTDGQRHRVWIVTDEQLIENLQKFFEDKSLLIADGHHRYETALQYYQEKREQMGAEAPGYDHALISIVNIYNPGLLVYPTYRLLTKSQLETDYLLKELSRQFDIEKFSEPASRDDLIKWLNTHQTSAVDENLAIGLYTPEKDLYKLVFKTTGEEEKPEPWLDTMVLQENVFSNIFGMNDEEKKDESVLEYVKDGWEAKEKVDSGEAKYLFFVNKPSVEEIIHYAEKGTRIPQKSTYFYPKFVTGLIMLKLGE